MQINHLQIPKWIFIAIIIVSLIGFADATFLVVEHYANAIPPCTTGGCETVLLSSYSKIFGIPVAIFGSTYYLLMLVLLISFLDTKNEKILRTSMFLTTFGFLFSLYFLFLQAFVIHAYCQYCLLSAATSTTLFIFAIYIFKKYRIKS